MADLKAILGKLETERILLNEERHRLNRELEYIKEIPRKRAELVELRRTVTRLKADVENATLPVTLFD